MKRILLVGESWVSNSTHYKGFDQFQSTTYHLGADNLIKVIDKDVYNIEYLKAHEAAESFPSSLADLKQYSAIIFSDIEAIQYYYILKFGYMVRHFQID